MISPVAIALALAFWTPYSGAPLPCTAANVHAYDVAPAGVPVDALGYGPQPGYPSCDVWVNNYIDAMSVEQQCGIIAHELGHTWMMLGHSDDPRNVMHYDAPVPGACRPPVPPKPTPKKRKHREAASTHHPGKRHAGHTPA